MGKAILVVEDDEDMRGWLKLHLSNAGYSVRCVENGMEAAASCLQAKPDLVISDLHMPGMGGFDMAKILNSEKFLRHIPVIFLTADDTRRARGAELGAVEYLTKPVEPEVLLKAVEAHLVK
jgi:DNA-binding response OmpR family regulator